MPSISFNQFQQKYRFDCQLSQGSFGRVCKIQQSATKKYYALKKVMARKKQELEDAEYEIRLLNMFRHPFVIEIRETYNIQIKNGFARSTWEVGMVLELAKCSLQQQIRAKHSAGTFQFILEQTVGLIRILFLLQKQNIAHRDIKPANILVCELGENKYRWKLADFGLALDLNQSKEPDNFAGSFEYASPKLRRKFKYPNLRIKTNSFKDDVYSLGVTLLEVATGHRMFNASAYEKLKQVCSEKRLVLMIDMMLEEDEEKRPCFKQLMMLIQKQFTELSQVYEEFGLPSRKDSEAREKIEEIGHYNYLERADKTTVKKVPKLIDRRILKTRKNIQSVVKLSQEYLLCGCENGELLAVRGEQVIHCGKVHASNISQFFRDPSGGLWSAGADGFAFKWKTKQLLTVLQHNVKQTKQKKPKSLFNKKNEETPSYLSIEIEQASYTKFEFAPKNKSGISSFLCTDQQHMAAGFYDGYVSIRWGELTLQRQLFTKPVTSVKLSASECSIYFCSLDGQVKVVETVELNLLNYFHTHKNAQFIGMYIDESQGEQLISLLTLDGRQVVLNRRLECLYENSIARQMLIDSIYSEQNAYILTETGQLIDAEEEQLVDLGDRGWSCLASLGDQQLAVGSLGGEIAFLSW